MLEVCTRFILVHSSHDTSPASHANRSSIVVLIENDPIGA